MPYGPGCEVRAVERISCATEADARVLEHLAQLGCDESTPRESSHYVYLPDESSATRTAESLARDGWETRVESCDEPCDGDAWLVVAVHVCVLTPQCVTETRRTLEALAAKHRGFYDGWETRAD